MTIGPWIAKLLALGSASLNQSKAKIDVNVLRSAGTLGDELAQVLDAKNGFDAFESALHFFPAQTSLLSVGIDEWNDPDGWTKEYGDLAAGCLFFAEDIFGGQFCIASSCVWQFDPETGEKNLMAASLDEWAKKVLDDYEVLTGHPLAHAWQKKNGPLPEGMRLVPRIPFVCNGEFALSNLILMESEKGMRIRGSLARQIHDLPDGAQISFRIDS
ncbi:SMI1/KNR4 family protein [Pseudoxanthomonas wuyuanensis]|nr:SMI1/KNR4 family protein [Pseudoxanthomonas wuyuanensis]KAF1721287.1 SMI1/KNR4 family protein [Pseudoxanthomonas wuyuanensis]